ncbi:CD225/dispanin family protein [Myroides sp. LJL119]
METSKFESHQELKQKPNNYMALSIIATIVSLCSYWCIGFILGIVAIVMSSQSTAKYNKGDYQGSVTSAKNAKILAIVAIVVAVATYIYTYYTIQQAGGIDIFIEEFQNAMQEAQQQ